MKKFIKNSIIFASIIVVLSIAYELFLLTIENEYSYKRKYVENNGDAIKVLILGHSHAAYGLIPEEIGDSIFNMAISGRALYYDAQIAKRYVHTLKNLKAVIWPMLYDIQYNSYIYPKADNSFKHTCQCMYEKYMGISYEADIPYLHWSETLNSDLGLLVQIIRDEDSRRGCSKSGFVAAKNKLDGWEYNQLPSPHIDDEYTDLAYQEGITNLKLIAKSCKDAGVRLIVISFPYYKTAQEQITPRMEKEKMQCIEIMKSVYPSMEYYNYCFDERFDAEDFLNSTHLTKKGADKMSHIIKEELHL